MENSQNQTPQDTELPISEPLLNPTPERSTGCCSWARMSGGRALTGLLAVTTVLGIACSAYFAGQASVDQPQITFPSIDATASVTSEKFSMATGALGSAGEALFVLDHNSGLLKCSMLSPRTAQVVAVFQVNVAEKLAVGGKGGKYMMTTGRVNFRANSARPAAPLAVYVMDSNSGNYACYGIPFNDSMVNSNTPQQGVMVFLGGGSANPIADRDAR